MTVRYVAIRNVYQIFRSVLFVVPLSFFSGLGTQSSSLFVYGAIVLYAIYDSKSKHETDMETHIGAFFVAYLVAGIFSLVGCGMMAKLDIPAEFTYGRSYYFCLGSGILAIVQVTIATACCVCKTCECCECPEQSSSPPRTYVSNRAANDEVNNGYVSSAEGNELSYGVNTGVCDGVIVGNMEIEQTELTTVAITASSGDLGYRCQ
ncbi:uncharacterized protein [Argopecten irradians]|uniref:uncharacterized protein n=1 Tax=Argopecten irradians TaxID=31199 RepID=UPI00371987DF